MYTYLLLNIGSLLFPLALSFDRRVHFYTYWRALFPAVLLVGALFIMWDVAFTAWGVWFFNPAYLTGVYLLNLPMEEWLFFFTIPYACLFIYECLRAYFPNAWEGKWVERLSLAWGILLIGGAAFNMDRMYTCVTFFSAGLVLILTGLSRQAFFLGRFFQMYLIHLIPFFVVNGVLTA